MASSMQVDQISNNAGTGPVQFPHGSYGAICMQGTNTAGTSINNNTATVIPFTAVVDTNSGWASTKYTAPVTGNYRVSAQITLANLTNNNGTLTLAIRKNGTTLMSQTNILFPSATTFQWGTAINDIVALSATDYVEILVTQVTGSGQALLTTAGFNNIAVQAV